MYYRLFKCCLNVDINLLLSSRRHRDLINHSEGEISHSHKNKQEIHIRIWKDLKDSVLRKGKTGIFYLKTSYLLVEAYVYGRDDHAC